MFREALTWLMRGVHLVPIQPHSKELVAGFGAYSQHVTTEQEASFWFRDRACNLGLVCGRGLVVLDFDDVGLYRGWAADDPDLAESYSEQTARGVHVFFIGDCGSGKIGNIEVKGRGSVIMAAPSVHPSGLTYSVLYDGDLIPHSPFLPFSDPKSKALNERKNSYGDDTIGRIKVAFPIVDFVMTAWPTTRLKPSGARGFMAGHCPFHSDKHASFWVHPDGVYGCHGCDAHGDVVNLYARRYGLTVQDAISEMARGL